MKIVAYAVFGILIIILLIVAVRYALGAKNAAPGPAAVGLGLPAASTTVSTANLLSEPVAIDGTAILDTSSGLPAVPFISYIDANGRTRTKQLIFANERGCFPGAGDLPCVPNYTGADAYPHIQTGQHIHAEGYLRDDRFLLTSLSVETSTNP